MDPTAGARFCRWPPGTLVTWNYSWPPGVSSASTLPTAGLAAVSRGVASWAAACGVHVLYEPDPAQARVLVGFGTIDGPGGILGETELPCDGNAEAQHTMCLDVAEAWTEGLLEETARHEFGHAIGMEHSPPGTPSAMSAYLDPAIRGLQPWDVAQAQARYPGPATPTPDLAPAAPANTQAITLKFSAPAAGDYTLTLAFSLAKDP